MKSKYIVSSDKQTKLHLIFWEPDTTPLGVIQIVHGMAEYIGRYQDFAKYLTTLGYVVVGHDHLGHGKSVAEQEPKHGYFGNGESAKYLIEDVQRVKQTVEELYPRIPYFILGHSMGSFVLRNYLQSNHDPLSGVIFMGTGTGSAILPVVMPLTATLNQTSPDKVNHFLDKLAFGSFSKRFPETSRFNWLSKNQQNVKRYEEDELTGFTFTNNGFHTLFQLIHGANRKGWANTIDKALPILIISGEQDPVGDYGKGIKRVAKTLHDAGVLDVTMMMFTELRHEILFEEEKEQIYVKISEWIENHRK